MTHRDCTDMLNQTTTPVASSGLIRILGVGFGLAVIVGSTLGIGILRTPGLVAAQIPTPTGVLLVWLAGGLFTLLTAACLAELGTMLPEAGGYYVYARRAFGDATGFAVGWTDWITYCAVLGYISIAIGEFAALLQPSLVGLEKAAAIATLAALAALQMAGLRASSRFQEIATGGSSRGGGCALRGGLGHYRPARGVRADDRSQLLDAPANRPVLVCQGG